MPIKSLKTASDIFQMYELLTINKALKMLLHIVYTMLHIVNFNMALTFNSLTLNEALYLVPLDDNKFNIVL
jgi:hypothetical protein